MEVYDDFGAYQIKHHLKEHQRIDKQKSKDEECRKRTEKTIDTLNHVLL